jgi:hypothetical protein
MSQEQKHYMMMRKVATGEIMTNFGAAERHYLAQLILEFDSVVKERDTWRHNFGIQETTIASFQKENAELRAEVVQCHKDIITVSINRLNDDAAGRHVLKVEAERDTLLSALKSAVKSLESIDSVDHVKTETEYGETEYWLNDNELRHIVDEALSAIKQKVPSAFESEGT